MTIVSPEEVKRLLKEARKARKQRRKNDAQYLRERAAELKRSDGRADSLKIGFSYGKAEGLERGAESVRATLEKAEVELRSDKSKRKLEGERQGKRDADTGGVEGDALGDEADAGREGAGGQGIDYSKP